MATHASILAWEVPWTEESGGLQSMARLEALVPSRDSRARTRSPSPRAWRPDFPGAAREAPCKIPQARLQQCMNHELPDVQSGFRKGRGTRDQIANICWIIEKAIEFEKNICFCFIDHTKAFDCVDHNKL